MLIILNMDKVEKKILIEEEKIEANQEEMLKEEKVVLETIEGKLQFITTAFDDAYSTMVRYCFVATDCKKVQEPKNGEDEFTELVIVPLEEFRQLLRSGKMTDVEVGYLALDFLHLL